MTKLTAKHCRCGAVLPYFGLWLWTADGGFDCCPACWRTEYDAHHPFPGPLVLRSDDAPIEMEAAHG